MRPHDGPAAPRRPAFRSPEAERTFQAAYDEVLALWPVRPRPLDVPTPHGMTRVLACGPATAPPVVLLHGSGATSTVWAGVAGRLAATHRVLAVDQIGDAGRSVHDGAPLRSPADLTGWLRDVLVGLDVPRAVLVGHSYGSWLALRLALDAPDRVERLVLLDPSDCVVGLRAGYRARAVPLFVAPGAARTRRFLAWESRDAALPPVWLHLAGLAGEVRRSRVVLPRRPSAAELAGLRAPVLQLVAGLSRAVDPARSVDQAARRLPDVTSQVLPDATHHTLPLLGGDDVARRVASFLA